VKVAIITLRFASPGGVETNVHEVARRLIAAGDDTRVYASDLFDEGQWQRRTDFPAVYDGIPVEWFTVRKKLIPGLTLPMMVGLVDALGSSGTSVIHAHSHRYGHVLESAAVAERTGIPLVVSMHYHPADRRETPWRRGLLRVQDMGFGATAYRVARALVVETEHEAELVREFAPADRIRIIPPGITLSEWARPEEDRLPDTPLPEGYFLFAGRIASNKGLPGLFDAVARMEPAHRPPLVLMGHDWGERPALEAQARRLGIADRVQFLGHVRDPREYRGVMRHARAFVLPSEYEAFGIVLLEAMVAGTPIVATAVGGVPEVLLHGQVGRLVEYDDADALARAMRDVTSDPDGTAERVRKGRERVRAFDWSSAVEQTRELYREVAGV
jgi:alpha-maltose-1-phosphate synthase